MRIIDKILTGVSVALVTLGLASIESTPVVVPILMIAGGGLWLIYAANIYKWD